MYNPFRKRAKRDAGLLEQGFGPGGWGFEPYRGATDRRWTTATSWSRQHREYGICGLWATQGLGIVGWKLRRPRPVSPMLAPTDWPWSLFCSVDALGRGIPGVTPGGTYGNALMRLRNLSGATTLNYGEALDSGRVAVYRCIGVCEMCEMPTDWASGSFIDGS